MNWLTAGFNSIRITLNSPLERNLLMFGVFCIGIWGVLNWNTYDVKNKKKEMRE